MDLNPQHFGSGFVGLPLRLEEFWARCRSWFPGKPTFYFFSTNGSGFLHVSPDVWRDFTDLTRADDYSCSVTQSQLDFKQNKTKKTKHLDQLCAGIPTRTNGSIVQVPHFLFFLTCLQDKTGKQVEDFYNSRCGGPASERCRVPVRYRGLFEYAHIQTATERECFSLTLSEEKGAVQRWFKEQSEQNRTQRCRMSKKHKEGGNSFSHRSTSSSLKKKKKFFMSSSFKTQQVFVVMDLKYLLSSTESQEPDEGVCQEKLFAQRK